jgi:hypothetical protein
MATAPDRASPRLGAVAKPSLRPRLRASLYRRRGAGAVDAPLRTTIDGPTLRRGRRHEEHP